MDKKQAEHLEGVLPLRLVNSKNEIIEVLYCGAIDGGGNYNREHMPDKLRLVRHNIETGVETHAVYDFRELV